MGNVLGDEKKQQVLALGRLGWSLRRIEEATAVRRETASAYLKAARLAVRARDGRPGVWPPKPATTAGSAAAHVRDGGGRASCARSRRETGRLRVGPWRTAQDLAGLGGRRAATQAPGSRRVRERVVVAGRPASGLFGPRRRATPALDRGRLRRRSHADPRCGGPDAGMVRRRRDRLCPTRRCRCRNRDTVYAPKRDVGSTRAEPTARLDGRVSWSHDGGRLAIALGGGGMRPTGPELWVLDRRKQAYQRIAFSPLVAG